MKVRGSGTLGQSSMETGLQDQDQGLGLRVT